MELKRNSRCEVLITGNIKKIEHCQKIQGCLESMLKEGCGQITLKIPDSFAFPSDIMGDMAKLSKNGQTSFRVQYGDKRLGRTLKALEMERFFQYSKI